MSTVNWLEEYDAAMQQYIANIGYHSADSLTMAHKVLEACDILLVILPKMIQSSGPSSEMLTTEHRSIETARARAWDFITRRPLADEAEQGYLNTECLCD